MYRILLVDDEEVVREGIAHTIDWARHGFELAGLCDNGRDAADAVTALRPDLVITDICMPFGDGLDLTEFVAREHPSTKVILLTGYDEFSYAQRAVRLNAYDYVLKPITADELRALLDRVRGDLDRERARSEERRRGENEAGAAAARRERFVTQLLAGELAERELRDACRSEFGVPFEGAVALLALDRDDGAPAWRAAHAGAGDQSPDFKRLALASLCRDAVNSLDAPDAAADDAREAAAGGERALGGAALACVQDPEGRIAVVAAAPTPAAADLLAESVAARLRAEANERLHCTVGIGIGEAVSPLSEIARSYRGAVAALDRRFLAGCNCIVKASELGSAANDGAREDSHDATGAAVASSGQEELRGAEARLIRSIKNGTLLDMLRAADDVTNHLRRSFVSTRASLLSVHRLFVLIAEVCGELGIEIPELEEGWQPNSDVFALATLDEVEQRLRALCGSIAEAENRGRESWVRAKAANACTFIKEHLADPELSLNSVCRELALSASSFSALFKESTGKTFIEYLTAERIDRAKMLLRTTAKKNYEIAQDVGYSDQHYFSIIFKRETGVTPSQYRAALAAGSR